MSMSMFELEANLEGLMARIELFSGPDATEEEAELLKAAEQELGDVLSESAAKRDAVAYYIRHETLEADGLAAIAKEFSDRAKVHMNRASRTREMVLKIMQATGRGELSGDAFRFKLARNPSSVEIVDEAAIPELYTHTQRVVEKAAISKALKSGVEVPGATLVEGKERVDIKAR